jgi:hypothetical protein
LKRRVEIVVETLKRYNSFIGKILPSNGQKSHVSDINQIWFNKKKGMPLVGGLCHITDFDQEWSKNVPLVGGLYHVTDFDQINGPKVRPSSEDFVTSRTSTKYGPKMCPSSEDFVTSRTSTKYGPKMCPSSEDFATSRAFDQVLSDMCRSSRQITITFEKKADFWYPQYERYLSHFEGQHKSEYRAQFNKNDAYHVHHATTNK